MFDEITNDNIGLIFVFFHPTAEQVERVRCFSMLYPGAVIDNTPGLKQTESGLGRFRYFTLGQNSGIAHAQNVGFRYLMQNEAIHYFVLFDQDSEVAVDYPLNMARQHQQLSATLPLAALGPMVVDKDSQEAYHSVIHHDRVWDNGFVPHLEIIASGSCISRDALCRVGLNDEALFIDFVDSEWCFRARHAGLVCGLTRQVTMNHKVGVEVLHVGRHMIVLSKPYRYYYQYRNLLILNARDYVPLRFKFFKSVKFLLRYLYFPFLVRGGGQRWKYMNAGIRDGVKALIKKKKS